MTEYRIVEDNYLGFEVQERHWWWPFWMQSDFANTHSSLQKAEAFARELARRRSGGRVVKTLGSLPARSSSTPSGGGDE